MLQNQALDIMKLGHNVFLTGEPGAGKTHTLIKFIEHCLKHDISVGVTASTGIAATHIGGMTIHSWSGIGINDWLDDEAVHKLATKPRLQNRFKKTRVLIIDEVSMLDSQRLELINSILKTARQSEKPFGRLQVILCGDLFQLPPVSRQLDESQFAYTSSVWGELNLKVCYLSEQHRQDEDMTLLDLLRQIRAGEVTEDSYTILQERLKSQKSHEDITRLYTHNVDVDKLNHQKLAAIKTKAHSFEIQAKGQKQFIEQLKRSCLAPEVLELKTGAQVICLANNPTEGFMNGSRGEVVGFENGQPVVRLLGGQEIKMARHSWTIQDGEKVLAEITQYPLRLAWAITVHKSQGMSLDEAEVDLSHAFTPGQGYVALSRLRNLEGLHLRGMNNLALMVSPAISEYDQLLQKLSAQAAENLLTIPKNQLEESQQHIRANLSLDYPEYNKDLLANLKKWRRAQAKSEGVPAYRVFDDKTLLAIAAEVPATPTQLLSVPGVGPKKLESYSGDLFKLINQATGKLL